MKKDASNCLRCSAPVRAAGKFCSQCGFCVRRLAPAMLVNHSLVNELGGPLSIEEEAMRLAPAVVLASPLLGRLQTVAAESPILAKAPVAFEAPVSNMQLIASLMTGTNSIVDVAMASMVLAYSISLVWFCTDFYFKPERVETADMRFRRVLSPVGVTCQAHPHVQMSVKGNTLGVWQPEPTPVASLSQPEEPTQPIPAQEVMSPGHTPVPVSQEPPVRVSHVVQEKRESIAPKETMPESDASDYSKPSKFTVLPEQKADYTDTDVAEYNRLLADYFAKKKEQSDDKAPVGESSGLPDGQPPAFKEWLGLGKVAF